MHLPNFVRHTPAMSQREKVESGGEEKELEIYNQHWYTKYRTVKVIQKAEDELEEGNESTHSAVL